MAHTFTVCPQCKSLNKLSSERVLKEQPVCGKCKAEIKLHGLVTEVNAQDFQRILSASDRPVAVDFWASWCRPCQVFGPEFERASKVHTDKVFLKMSTETEQTFAAQMGIRGIPCTVIFKDGKEVGRQSGAMNALELGEFLNSIV